ncbi:hypothetical protein [Roseicella aerolata]|uniref:Pentapeptide MXKDX repeat protein n=1 Tax=Roseicella aerolata TaxID=2883479 RepID=A0A9X1LCD0_9PROT|nr:hypothetical protein [Roseicella aerolata]MCB4824080.1 hypothetical protein [Roseicella aerolata]
MRLSGIVAAAAAVTLAFATFPADAASERQHRGASMQRGASPSDNMADELNAQSLRRAQSGAEASGMDMQGSGMGMQGSGMGMHGGSTGMQGSGMGGSMSSTPMR